MKQLISTFIFALLVTTYPRTVKSWNRNKFMLREQAIKWPNAPSQSYEEAKKEFYSYLYRNLMPFDIPNAGTLGFITDPFSNNLPDGLSDGIIYPSIYHSLDAKLNYPWTRAIEKQVYLEYVVSFSNVNEARSNIRPLLVETLNQTLEVLLQNAETTTIHDVVYAVNRDLWSLLGGIKFVSGQTPLIFDPMSIIAFKYASCTGLSILFVDALRSVGVPSRIVGTPAWNGNVTENGNHNWIEYYAPDESKWIFLEATPAANFVPPPNPTPDLFWFCNADKFDGTTLVFAARLDRDNTGDVFYPMPWDIKNQDVPADDRTAYYTSLCSSSSSSSSNSSGSSSSSSSGDRKKNIDEK